MMRLNRKIRKVLALILAAGLIISITSCGQKEAESIDEYGGKEVTTTAALLTDEDDFGEDESASSVGKTLREFYGSYIKWDDVINAQNREIKVHITSVVPNQEGLNVYKVDNTADSSQEEALLERLFDDGYEKLEEIGYTNETDYIMHLYKLRRLSGELTGNYMYTYKVIDSSFENKYQWTDNANYAIHMYKGKYQGIDYGLILAYDYVIGSKYITFLPVSIRDYYPDYDFKTLMIEGTEDIMGNPYDVENNCYLSPDDVKDQATEFLESRLGIAGYICKVGNDYEGYVNNLGDMSLSVYYGVPNTSCMSMLNFSKSDFISTYKTTQDSTSFRHNYLLAEQRDIVAEYTADHNSMDESQALWMSVESDRVDKDVELYRDGYAVYLQNPFQIEYDINDLMINVEGGQLLMTQGNAFDNNGCIMITSKGLFGVDIKLSADVYDVTDNVELLSFDKVKESLKNALENEVNLKSVSSDKVEIPLVVLNYAMLVDENDPNDISMVPVWEFKIVYGDTIDFIQINAMDGSFVGTSIF